MERLLGAGAMGEVWEARHVLLDRVVAIKLLGSQLRLVADRLVIEAQALARVRHPAIVEVYDCGTLEDGTPYIAMERLRGETLANAIGRGPLPVATAVRLFIPLLDGLAAAHRAGVIHRDIKPENIFLADDASSGMTPKLIDFGIARIENGGPRATLDGSLIGTPAYMSPEQFRGERSGEPADFWSAAASLYEVITGKPPFGDDQIATIMHRVIEAPLPYPRKVAGFDGRLWSFLARGLRKLPDQRFPSAEAMRDELIAWLAKAPPAPTDARAAAPVAPAAAKATQPYRPSAPGVASTPPTPEPQATLDHTIRQKLR
jgi:serine/threonine-protein kinase